MLEGCSYVIYRYFPSLLNIISQTGQATICRNWPGKFLQIHFTSIFRVRIFINFDLMPTVILCHRKVSAKRTNYCILTKMCFCLLIVTKAKFIVPTQIIPSRIGMKS